MPWKITSSSVQGAAHKVDGTPCQDFSECYTFPSDNLAIGLVADGAGSAQYSQIGAETAVRKALPFLKKFGQHLKDKKPTQTEVEDLFREIGDAILSELQNKSRNHSCSIHDFACTFLSFLATPDWLIAFQIGDGFIVYKTNENNLYRLLFMPQKGEFENETVFVTSSHAFENALIFNGPVNLEFVCASTDGIDHASLDKTKGRQWVPHAAFFEPLRAELSTSIDPQTFAKEITTFLDSEIFARITGDDKTIVLALHQDSPLPPVWDQASSFRVIVDESIKHESRTSISLPDNYKRKPASHDIHHRKIDADSQAFTPRSNFNEKDQTKTAQRLEDIGKTSQWYLRRLDRPSSRPFQPPQESRALSRQSAQPHQHRRSRQPLPKLLLAGLLITGLVALTVFLTNSLLPQKHSIEPKASVDPYVQHIFTQPGQESQPVGFLVVDSKSASKIRRPFEAWLYLKDIKNLSTQKKTVLPPNNNSMLYPLFNSRTSPPKKGDLPIGYVFPGTALTFLEVKPSENSERGEKMIKIQLYFHEAKQAKKAR